MELGDNVVSRHIEIGMRSELLISPISSVSWALAKLAVLGAGEKGIQRCEVRVVDGKLDDSRAGLLERGNGEVDFSP